MRWSRDMSAVTSLERFFLSLDARSLAAWDGLYVMVRESKAFARAIAAGDAAAVPAGVLVAKGGGESVAVGQVRTPALVRDGGPARPALVDAEALKWIVSVPEWCFTLTKGDAGT